MGTVVMNTLGIIAGSRGLPLLVAREARRLGVKSIVAVAVEGETDPAISGLADQVVWVKVGQLGRLIEAFRERGVQQCVMAGQIAPKNLFDLRPDLRAMKLLWSVKERHAHSLFAAVGRELERDGIQLIDALPWLGPALVQPGYQAGPALTEVQWQDLRLGARVAREVARLEIGQTVVVKEGVVLAVEAFEGTDSCLARGGELAGRQGGAVAVKLPKAGHDMRFDIPCAGAKTVETCGQSGVRVLALEPGRTILLERAETEMLCRQQSVSLVALPAEPNPR